MGKYAKNAVAVFSLNILTFGQKLSKMRQRMRLLNALHQKPSALADGCLLKKEHVLRLNESDERPILKNVLESHPWYNLSHVQAKLVVEQVQEAVSRWQIVAKDLDLKASEMKWMSAVFPENTASKRKPLRKMFP